MEKISKQLRRASKMCDLVESKDGIKNELDIEEEMQCFKNRMLQRGLSLDVVDINVSLVYLSFIKNSLDN